MAVLIFLNTYCIDNFKIIGNYTFFFSKDIKSLKSQISVLVMPCRHLLFWIIFYRFDITMDYVRQLKPSPEYNDQFSV